MTKEEILKNNYMQLPDACEADWQVGSADEMHQCILTSMEQYASQQLEEKEKEVHEVELKLLDCQQKALKHLEVCALTESQRKEWADMCIKKQARIEELEACLKSYPGIYAMQFDSEKMVSWIQEIDKLQLL